MTEELLTWLTSAEGLEEASFAPWGYAPLVEVTGGSERTLLNGEADRTLRLRVTLCKKGGVPLEDAERAISALKSLPLPSTLRLAEIGAPERGFMKEDTGFCAFTVNAEGRIGWTEQST